eukprot:g19773.t1
MGDADGEGDGLTGPDRLKYTEAFNIFDKHQQGYIPWKPDFAKLWRAIGQNPTEAELRRIIEENDTGTGHFQLEASFKTFDKDGKGTLTIAQIRYVMMTMGDPLNDEEADRFIDFADKNKEGPTAEIDYEELVERLDETWKGYFLRNLQPRSAPGAEIARCSGHWEARHVSASDLSLTTQEAEKLLEKQQHPAVLLSAQASVTQHAPPKHPDNVGFMKSWPRRGWPLPALALAINLHQVSFVSRTKLASFAWAARRSTCLRRDFFLAAAPVLSQVPLPLAFTAKAETELFDNALPESQAQLYRNFGLKPNIGLQLVGHDASYMNPAAHSLVSRVCNNDRTLIMADAQASLIENINAYLGIENLQMHGSCFSPGVLLCTLCIMQWCLYLFEEFRMIVSTSFAIWQVPRAASSLRSNQITGISFTRLVAHGLLTLLRTCIAVVLLNAGILWLAIEDLMVNGVALVTIINVDERLWPKGKWHKKLFAALMPRRIQRKVEELYAVTPRSSKRGSQAESLDIDFVMKVNPSVGVPVALDTAPYLKDENRSFSEVATRDFLGSRADPCLKIQMYYMVLWVGADLCPVAY